MTSGREEGFADIRADDEHTIFRMLLQFGRGKLLVFSIGGVATDDNERTHTSTFVGSIIGK